MPKTIEDVWRENGFPMSYKVLWEAVKKAKVPNVRGRDVVKFLKDNNQWNIVNARGRPKYFDSVVARSVGSNLMVDLMIYDRYEINKYKYILNCIDIKSRYAYGVALTNKTSQTVADAMVKVFKWMGKVPETLQMDNGTEFTSKIFKDTMAKEGVHLLHYSDVGDIRKQSVIERFNRTLAGDLRKWRENTGGSKWYQVLDTIYKQYNNREHRTIKAKPIDVWEGRDENKQTIVRVVREGNEEKFKVGDRVRIIENKNIFQKADDRTLSEEVYTIKAKDGKKWMLSNGKRYSDYQLVLDTSRLKPTPKESRTKAKDKAQVEENQKQKKIARKATNELKNVGAKSKFDKGVEEASKKKRVTAPKPVPAPKTRDDKGKQYIVDYYIHEFKNDVVVKWKGFPLAEATREPKSVQIKGMGEANFKAGISNLKKFKNARKIEYDRWKELRK